MRDPVAVIDLGVELSFAPAREAGEHPPASRRVRELLEVGVGGREADPPHDQHPGGIGIKELRQQHDRARLHRASDVDGLLSRDRRLERRHGLADGDRGGAVEDDAECAFLAVHADQHHAAPEVRIEQRRRGEQQLTGKRFLHQ